MPTILLMRGWRLFFYSDEREEPPHIHARKGDMDCKYWLYPNRYDIGEAASHNMSPNDYREIRKIIFDNFDYILSEYETIHRGEP